MTFPSFNSTGLANCPTVPAPFGSSIGNGGSVAWAPVPSTVPQASAKRQQVPGRHKLTRAEIAKLVRKQQLDRDMVPTMPDDLKQSDLPGAAYPASRDSQSLCLGRIFL